MQFSLLLNFYTYCRSCYIPNMKIVINVKYDKKQVVNQLLKGEHEVDVIISTFFFSKMTLSNLFSMNLK